MSALTEMLVQNEDAAAWVDTMSLETARHAHVGRPADFTGNSAVFNAVTNSGKAVGEAIDFSKRLAKDTSRTPDARHEAAEGVINQRIAVIEEGERVLQAEAQKYYVNAEEMVTDTFAAKPNTDFLNFALSAHIHKLATTKENGIAEIRDMVANDIDVAKLIYASKSYLLGIEKGVLENLKVHAAKVHVPAADALMDQCEALVKLASGYPKVRADMRRNLFSKALADRARATRVEV